MSLDVLQLTADSFVQLREQMFQFVPATGTGPVLELTLTDVCPIPATHHMPGPRAGFSLLFVCDAPHAFRQGMGSLRNSAFGAADLFMTRVLPPLREVHRPYAFLEAVFN